MASARSLGTGARGPPARAGRTCLAAIVLASITELGSFELFLTAGLIAGIIQLVLGFVKAGSISNYFPNSVIEGMLAGIGVIIILKQIPWQLLVEKL